ncbi:hypothetical protein Tco_0940104 [Tanacetum coccineum]|uniref:Uncharacterized protein n=1 Tax=Tanacetum coccineum TaxID=301880 RepID=A0ABQ5DTS5_9ASTR
MSYLVTLKVIVAFNGAKGGVAKGGQKGREISNQCVRWAGFDQVDKTESTGLEESIHDQNKGKTSSEVESAIIPHVLNLGQIHDLLANSHEEFQNFSYEEILATSDDMEIEKLEHTAESSPT